ncbi:TBC1 domain family member 2A isoform X1 [Gambusia affinis]|uniref:TBC1 domain family member 2A isoform X1 n=1 Tax=Gambusia affinis TaxID=33528 RepID=UPI001CDB99CF|nr:TBC1 domain family member 2A isoform X1 [Gambusia affinis]XP_043982551.1 TBC1 domain family member 2A isoform X1 [Gambusia affinis]XP_043982552.1 TBC1 domain family member 2A isoform X1 [Gambusia affinis]
MDGGSPASDSLPVPTDPVRMGPDSQNQEAVRSGPGCLSGSPEPTEPPSSPQSTRPEPPGSEQTEPGGSAGLESAPETSSQPVLQNPEGSTDQAEEEPGSDPPEVLTAGPEEPGVHQNPQCSEELHQNPGEVLSAEEGGFAASRLGRPGRTECLDLQNRQAPPPSGQVWPRPLGTAGEPRLCGFLQKQAGPLRAWKRRWFSYEQNQNQLFYFRSPQDVAPLGRIRLSGATFTCPPITESGTFHIQTPERTFILKAVSQELMLYWLQQLQMKRWQHRDTSAGPDRTNNNNNNLTDDFLPRQHGPVGLVGEAAAVAPAQCSTLSSVSIKHPLIQIQNSVHSLRKRTSQNSSQSSVFYADVLPWTGTGPEDGGACADNPAGQRSASRSLSWRSKSRVSSSVSVPCGDAASSERTSRLQQEKQMLMEEVKAQKELVWILHKALEASQLEKRSCSEFLAAQDERRRLELLRHGERLAADLRARLDSAKMEAEALRRRLDDRDAQLAELQEEVRLLEEKNAAKQQVIMKLTDQVTSCLLDPGHPDSSGSVQNQNHQNHKELQQQMENLKDDLVAYQTQNRFLNSEIHQLTKLWRKSSEQERSLMVKCAYLEATNCQMESRYLGVLRSLQEAKALAPEQQEAVQRLIQDALGGEAKGVVKLSADRDHDEYGFKIVPDYEVEDMKLLAKIQALEIRGLNLLQQDSMERPLLARWAQYLAGHCEDDMCPSPELKALLRAGVPQQYRQRVWRWLVRTRTRTVWERHPQRYQQLCEKSRMSPHPACRQIQLDLHRTLTTNQNFSSPSSPTLQQLSRVLLAFSWQNPAVGYCQGLNRLAAVALLVLQSEEDAFWCLVALVDTIMPQDYYTKNLLASQADQRVLKDFMAEKLPRLAAHLEGHGVDVSLVTFNWFLVVFVESLPSDILLPLWDAFLYEGSKVIFRYTLALFKYKEDDLLKIHDSVEIYQYLRFFTKTVTDSRKLAAIAFCDMNPFPRRLLRNRRALHLERLQGELQELEEQQKEFVTESVERKDKELDPASEDDDEL